MNQNRGMYLAPPKKDAVSEECFFGATCNRPGCIYRHSSRVHVQSKDPCMAYLAGICKFDAKSCLKRHPDDAECEQLIAKYSSKVCRFGDKCKTKGCLYQHKTQPAGQTSYFWEPPPVPLHDPNAFPPLEVATATTKDTNERIVIDEAFPPLTAATTTATDLPFSNTNDGIHTNDASYTVYGHFYPPIGYGAPVWTGTQCNASFPAPAFTGPFPMAGMQHDDSHDQTQQPSPPNHYP